MKDIMDILGIFDKLIGVDYAPSTQKPMKKK
jgi:hypothetical protein